MAAQRLGVVRGRAVGIGLPTPDGVDERPIGRDPGKPRVEFHPPFPDSLVDGQEIRIARPATPGGDAK